MALFLVASLPLLFSFVALLPWDRRQAPRTLTVVTTFLKGLMVFFPGYLAVLIVRAIFGFSYDGLLLYLSLLLRDHLAPLLAALGGFLLLQRKLDIVGTEESIFLMVFAFCSGFLSLVNITDALRTWGSWDAYTLFLLPGLRVATVAFVALVAERFYRWEGRAAAFFLAAGAGLCCVLVLSSFFYYSSRLGWAILLAVGAVLVSVVTFALQFPRALRG
jgi:hypothetical protein